MSALATSPWAARARRAEELRARHPFADELMALYLALLPVQEEAWRATRERPPDPVELPWWAAARVLPGVVDATVAAGPAPLRDLVRGTIGADALAGWLVDADLDPGERFIARACLAPVLEALGSRAGEASGGGGGCPCCGGLPQLSWVAASGELLMNGPRSLLCSRCATSWSFSRSTCPACGETDDKQLEVHAEAWMKPANGHGGDAPMFPHLRIAGCATCRRYLIEVDLSRDERAVPEVDELAALPLDLHAADQGLTKVTPNLMGF